MIYQKLWKDAGIFANILLTLILGNNSANASAEIAGPSFYIDHATLSVRNLDTAMRDFRKLGFSVISSGKFSDATTHNALIPFKDGFYVELFSMVNPKGMAELESLKKSGQLKKFMTKDNAFQQRFMMHIASGQGLSDFALSTAHLDCNKTLARLNSQGIKFSPPIEMSRTRPDGKKVIWEISMPKTDALPFLIKDITPRSLRNNAETPKKEQKKLGLIGVAGITVVVGDLAKRTKQYELLLSIKPNFHSHYPLENARTVDFNLGHSVITLASPIHKNGRLYQYLLTHGEGPYILRLYTNKPNTGMLDLKLSQRAWINLIPLNQSY